MSAGFLGKTGKAVAPSIISFSAVQRSAAPPVTALLQAWSAGEQHCPRSPHSPGSLGIAAPGTAAHAPGADWTHPSNHGAYPRGGTSGWSTPTPRRLAESRPLLWHRGARNASRARGLRPRARLSETRWRGLPRVTLDESLVIAHAPDADLVALDAGLNALAKVDPRKSCAIELRFFGGLSIEEAALVLDVSPETVKRDCRLAKAWLLRWLHPSTTPDRPTTAGLVSSASTSPRWSNRRPIERHSSAARPAGTSSWWRKSRGCSPYDDRPAAFPQSTPPSTSRRAPSPRSVFGLPEGERIRRSRCLRGASATRCRRHGVCGTLCTTAAGSPATSRSRSFGATSATPGLDYGVSRGSIGGLGARIIPTSSRFTRSVITMARGSSLLGGRRR